MSRSPASVERWSGAAGERNAYLFQLFGRRRDDYESRAGLLLGIACEGEVDVSFAGRNGRGGPVERFVLSVHRFGGPLRILCLDIQQQVEVAVETVVGELDRPGGGDGKRRRENLPLLNDEQGFGSCRLFRWDDEDVACPESGVGVVGHRHGDSVAGCRCGDPACGLLVGSRCPRKQLGGGGDGHLLRGGSLSLKGERGGVYRQG